MKISKTKSDSNNFAEMPDFEVTQLTEGGDTRPSPTKLPGPQPGSGKKSQDQ